MTLEEFATCVQVLTDTFPVPGIEKRISSLHHFFQGISPQNVRAAADRIAREEERFPTPKTFGEYVNQVTAPPSTLKEREPCGFCDGYGMTTIRNADGTSDAYRGRCPHSRGLSERIPLAPSDMPTTPIRKKAFSDNFFEVEMERINRDPVMYMRGFALTGGLLKKMSPDNYVKVKEYLLDVLGKDRAKSIAMAAQLGLPVKF